MLAHVAGGLWYLEDKLHPLDHMQGCSLYINDKISSWSNLFFGKEVLLGKRIDKKRVDMSIVLHVVMHCSS